MFPHGKVKSCFFPQIMALDEIHKQHPNATFVLPTRDPGQWVTSVNSWGEGARWGARAGFTSCDLPTLPAGTPPAGSDTELRTFYVAFSKTMRAFVAQHPSHTLVEVELQSPAAAQKMSRAFGIEERCWGRANCYASCGEWSEMEALSMGLPNGGGDAPIPGGDLQVAGRDTEAAAEGGAFGEDDDYPRGQAASTGRDEVDEDVWAEPDEWCDCAMCACA